jgi:uroporphyrin-III C-methyltransferase / precorrin-2 dehydrogenase / sirohydrochlorin ferrochelatase
LLQAGAQVTVVAPEITGELAERAGKGEITWLGKAFKASDLDGKFLVIAATAIAELNAAVFREADARQILCNAVDDIENCHFYYGSVVQRGDLQIAISTNGKSPALAQRLRKELEEQFRPEYAEWVDWLGEERLRERAASVDVEETKKKLHELASRGEFERFAPDGAKKGSLRDGVYLVGAGPGDAELLTRKAARVIESADIVLHDSLVSAEILKMIAAGAARIDVGKRAGFRLLTQADINALLVDAARKYRVVVRLKGGDPLLFGRAAEEIEALRAAKIAFEIVPGISAGFASAAAAQVSLTDRRLASHVLFTTYSRSPETAVLPVMGITSETTVVVYMPGADYAGVSDWLVESGIARETPCLVVSRASQRQQAVELTTLARLGSFAALAAPALLIVGRVASHSAAAGAGAGWLREFAQGSAEELSIL